MFSFPIQNSDVLMSPNPSLYSAHERLKSTNPSKRFIMTIQLLMHGSGTRNNPIVTLTISCFATNPVLKNISHTYHSHITHFNPPSPHTYASGSLSKHFVQPDPHPL